MQSDLPDGVTREMADRAHFDRIAQAYTRKDTAPSSRVARAHRLASTLSAVNLPEEPDVLEVGCGAGYAVDYAPIRFGSYLGIDHSVELIEVARSRHSGSTVEFRSGRVQDVNFDATFDCVYVIGVLHHLEDVDEALARMVGSLRPGGWLVVNEPQPSNPVISVARRLRKRVDRTYSSDQVEFRANELEEMFLAAGLVDASVRAQGFLSTPFAEVPLPLGAVSARLVALTVKFDEWAERRGGAQSLAWNCVAAARRPLT